MNLNKVDKLFFILLGLATDEDHEANPSKNKNISLQDYHHVPTTHSAKVKKENLPQQHSGAINSVEESTKVPVKNVTFRDGLPDLIFISQQDDEVVTGNSQINDCEYTDKVTNSETESLGDTEDISSNQSKLPLPSDTVNRCSYNLLLSGPPLTSSDIVPSTILQNMQLLPIVHKEANEEILKCDRKEEISCIGNEQSDVDMFDDDSYSDADNANRNVCSGESWHCLPNCGNLIEILYCTLFAVATTTKVVLTLKENTLQIWQFNDYNIILLKEIDHSISVRNSERYGKL